MIPIVPAIIPKSANDLKINLDRVNFSTEVHIDIVDGKFVPFISWPYGTTQLPKDIKNFTDKFTLEVDLMVEEPLKVAEDWIEAGADMLVFHTDTISLEDFKNFTQSTPVSVGISAINDTSLEMLLPYVDIADYLQLMGIAKIGTQGQPFDDRVLDRIKEIKKNFPNKTISVDGSVNKNTIKKLKEASVNRLIVGSAIVLSENPKEAYLELIAN